MSDLNEKQILKQLKEKLTTLLEQESKAEIERERRTTLIQKARLAIDLFSDSTTGTEDVFDMNINFSKFNLNSAGSVQRETEINLNGFDYTKGKTWKDKIKNYLTYTNKPATISELVNEFKKHEPNYTQERINGAMNNGIHAMLKKGTLKIYTPPVKMKGYYYANPTWFDGEVLKEEHIPDFKKKLVW